MSLLLTVMCLSGLLGVLASGACLVLLFILLLHQHRQVLLTYRSVKRLRGAVITMLSGIGGILLGAGGNCCCYSGIVPCLQGYNQDPDRTIMYWLYRHIFGPLGWCVSQSGWDHGMDVIGNLPVILAVVGFAAGYVLVRRRLTRAYRLEPRDWLPRCPYCLYNLTGNTSGVCPECGEKVPRR